MVDREKFQRVGDYFVVVGFGNGECLNVIQFDDDRNILESIIDVIVIFKSLGEKLLKGYICIEKILVGFLVDFNYGFIRQLLCFFCIRRGIDKFLLIDIG